MKKGFTLAEALITIGILGVVAVITIPNFLENLKERHYKTTSTNFERRFGEALQIMNSQNRTSGYETTKDFVNELAQHMKIIKICDVVTDCFPKKIMQSDEKSFIDTSTLTTSDKLGRAGFETKTVGVKFANGVLAILAYNPYTVASENVVNYTTSDFGNGKIVKLNTNVVSMIYDVSGFEKPNKNGLDVLGVNSNIGGGANSGCVEVGSFCVTDLGTNYESIPCVEGGSTKYAKYCGKTGSVNTDYWSGAKKACDDLGMHLPSLTELSKIWSFYTEDQTSMPSGIYWVTDEGNKQGYYLQFPSGKSNTTWKVYNENVMCVK